jgi:hypothetical protein
MRDVVTSEEADPTILARGTPGFSGADLENLVKWAYIDLFLIRVLIFFLFLFLIAVKRLYKLLSRDAVK